MPQRFLRPGIVTSRRFNACSWLGQTFYIRLLTLVDDFGRYDADPVILKSHAFPLHEDLRSSQVQKLCEELQANQLAIFYESDGKLVLQLTRWIEKRRAEKSKYPEFDNSCKQLYATDNKCAPSPSSSPSSSSPSITCPAVPDDGGGGRRERGGYHKDTRSALHILNEESGKAFREVDANLSVISARLKEPGVTLDGVRLMIKRQCKRWKGTPQAEYLRPETLFGKTKFDAYYAAKDVPVSEEQAVLRLNSAALNDELRRVDKAIADIRNSYDAHQDMGVADRARLKKLQDTRSELREKLGLGPESSNNAMVRAITGVKA